MTVTVVAAMDENRVIGRDGGLPWHIPEDLAHFKSVTMGNAVVMGRKTFDSIGYALPGRSNIVITRDKEWLREGVTSFDSLDYAIFVTEVLSDLDVFIIGGGEIYTEALVNDLVDRMILTEVTTASEGGDTWFPEFDLDDWSVTGAEHFPTHRITTFDRKRT